MDEYLAFLEAAFYEGLQEGHRDSISQLFVRHIGQVGNLDLDWWLVLACTNDQVYLW
jgi:hypothetical protein